MSLVSVTCLFRTRVISLSMVCVMFRLLVYPHLRMHAWVKYVGSQWGGRGQAVSNAPTAGPLNKQLLQSIPWPNAIVIYMFNTNCFLCSFGDLVGWRSIEHRDLQIGFASAAFRFTLSDRRIIHMLLLNKCDKSMGALYTRGTLGPIMVDAAQLRIRLPYLPRGRLLHALFPLVIDAWHRYQRFFMLKMLGAARASLCREKC